MKFIEAPQVVTINDTLNPLLWVNNSLIPEVRYKLLQIAKHFADTLKVKKLNLKDITISGSNASFNYSEYSDIDLHLVVELNGNSELEDYFLAKKNNFNYVYDVKIKGISVEVYVQDANQPHYSAGIYSVLDNKWLSKPSKQSPKISHQEVKNKAKNYAAQIKEAIKTADLQQATDTLDAIKRLRKAGLESGGEFSVENLAFKLMRSRGVIDKLHKHIDKLRSEQLSLREQMKITDLLNEADTQAVITNFQPGKSVEIALPDGTQIKKDLVKDPSAIEQTPTGPVFNLANRGVPGQTSNTPAKPITSGTPISVNTDPTKTLAKETQEEEEEDILASGKNKDIGGDPTDDLIDKVIDKKWERFARGDSSSTKPERKLPETDELYKWLTIAGLK